MVFPEISIRRKSVSKLTERPRALHGLQHPAGILPPDESLEQSKALLTAYHAELCARRRAQRSEMALVHDQTRNLSLTHLRTKETELRTLETARRKLFEQRNQRAAQRQHAVNRLTVRDLHPASDLTIKVPPYDFDWTSGSNQGLEHADHNAGTFDLAVQSIGNGESSVAAGVGFWFFSGAGNPMQRFAAVLDYFDDWWDSADWYVAHNNGRTRLWVFGVTEQAWVAQSDQTPSWSDGVGWLEDHGNDPRGEDGRVASETFFDAAPNSWYQCWIWSSADVFSDSGFFGVSASSIQLNIAVPLAVIGSLS
jgi:hypothetical protein